jgi:hypothetical protein
MDPNDLLKNPEQIQSLIAALQALLPAQQVQPSTETPKVSKMKTKTRKPKKDAEPTDNKFLSMPEFAMHKEDTKVDRMLCKNPPVSRARQFSMIEVVCRVCGRKESVSPNLVFDSPSRYKCNNCSTQAG